MAEASAPSSVRTFACSCSIGEGEHAAVGVMDHDDLARAEQLLGDDQRAERVAGQAAGVADDVGVALLQAERPGRDEPRIHAGDDRDLPRRRQRQVARGEAGGVAGVRVQ